MADDWKAGDLALCVRASDMADNPTSPGGIYQVERAYIHQDEGLLALDFVGVPNRGAYWYGNAFERFRKINPLTDAEREEALRELNTPERVS